MDFVDIGQMVQELWDTGRTTNSRWISDFGYEIPELEERARGKRWIVAQYLSEEKHEDNRMLLGLFPKPKYARKFLESEVLPGGYRTMMPGAVAVLKYDVLQAMINIIHLQCLFKTGDSVSRNLASKYGGARIHLLDELFNEAVEKNIPRVLYTPQHENPEYKSHLFFQAAQRYNYLDADIKRRINMVEFTGFI